MFLFLNPVIRFISYRFQPLVENFLSGNFKSQMGKPTVDSCTVPMFHVGRNMNHGAGQIFFAGLPSSWYHPCPATPTNI